MTRSLKELPLPDFYKPDLAGDVRYDVADVFKLQQEAEKWKQRFGLKPVTTDAVKIHLLIIDAQTDFSFPEGSLYVGGRSGRGAIEDNDRLAQFVYRNLRSIAGITPTMDTHLPYQVFYPAAHLRKDGSRPAPFTIISHDEYRAGEYKPDPVFAAQISTDPVWLQRQMIHYTKQLEINKKYQLQLWTYHCLLGSKGHGLSGVIEEARLFHSFARGADNIPEIKGGNPLTEHFSIFRPEVMTTWDGRAIPGVQKNTQLIEKLMKNDAVVIAGQAKSHCLAWSIEDLLNEIAAQDPKLAKKVYLLEDGTSPVVIPGVIDFTDQANAAFERFRDAGMNIVKSTDPIESWPGIRI